MKRSWALAFLFSISSFAQGNLYVLSTAYSGKSTLYRRGVQAGSALIEVAPNLSPSLSQDAVIRMSGGKLFVLERSLAPAADRIRIFNPQNVSEAPLSVSLSVGANPQDVVYVPNLQKAFVSQYGKNEIAVIDPVTGTILNETIDLSPFVFSEDLDGILEMHRMRLIGTKLYVTTQSQVNFSVTLPGSVITIDLAVNPYTISQALVPDFKNPTTSIQPALVDDESEVVIGYSGKSDFGTPADAQDGVVGLQRALGLYPTTSWNTDGVALGLGDLSDVAIRPAESGFYSAISGSSASSVWFTPFGETVGFPLLLTNSGFAHPELAVDNVNQKLYVVERNSLTQGKIRIIDTPTNAVYATWTVDIQRAPFSIALDESLTTSAKEVHPSKLGLSISPNPSLNGRSVLSYALSRAVSCQIRVTDALGRGVLTTTRVAQVGLQSIELNLSESPRGVYLVFVTCGAASGVARWVR